LARHIKEQLVAWNYPADVLCATLIHRQTQSAFCGTSADCLGRNLDREQVIISVPQEIHLIDAHHRKEDRFATGLQDFGAAVDAGVMERGSEFGVSAAYCDASCSSGEEVEYVIRAEPLAVNPDGARRICGQSDSRLESWCASQGDPLGRSC
jgi:hypothetical protein